MEEAAPGVIQTEKALCMSNKSSGVHKEHLHCINISYNFKTQKDHLINSLDLSSTGLCNEGY